MLQIYLRIGDAVQGFINSAFGVVHHIFGKTIERKPADVVAFVRLGVYDFPGPFFCCKEQVHPLSGFVAFRPVHPVGNKAFAVKGGATAAFQENVAFCVSQVIHLHNAFPAISYGVHGVN